MTIQETKKLKDGSYVTINFYERTLAMKTQTINTAWIDRYTPQITILKANYLDAIRYAKMCTLAAQKIADCADYKAIRDNILQDRKGTRYACTWNEAQTEASRLYKFVKRGVFIPPKPYKIDLVKRIIWAWDISRGFYPLM